MRKAAPLATAREFAVHTNNDRMLAADAEAEARVGVPAGREEEDDSSRAPLDGGHVIAGHAMW